MSSILVQILKSNLKNNVWCNLSLHNFITPAVVFRTPPILPPNVGFIPKQLGTTVPYEKI